mgnify:CR=1 FL=1
MFYIESIHFTGFQETTLILAKMLLQLLSTQSATLLSMGWYSMIWLQFVILFSQFCSHLAIQFQISNCASLLLKIFLSNRYTIWIKLYIFSYSKSAIKKSCPNILLSHKFAIIFKIYLLLKFVNYCWIQNIPRKQ